MKSISWRRWTMLAAGLLAMAAAHGEGDPAAGKEKTRMCAGCHGIDDYRTAYPAVYAVPRLGGQVDSYTVQALKDFRSGTRKHPVMQGMAAQLTDKDIADIAAFYADGGAK
jgi:cytochrome c553